MSFSLMSRAHGPYVVQAVPFPNPSVYGRAHGPHMVLLLLYRGG